MESGYRSVKRCRSRHLLGNLAFTYSTFTFFPPGLDFIRNFIYESGLLVETCLDELESFSAGLEEDVVKFRDLRARAQSLEQIQWSGWSHIYH